MVCDYDAIYAGKFNFKAYDRIAKFFELVVVNFASRMEDVMDSLISGAYSVVIDPGEPPETIRRMLEVSENIIMPYNSESLVYFLNNGGKYVISEREVMYSFRKCYNVGMEIKGEKYVNVVGFPENLLPYI